MVTMTRDCESTERTPQHRAGSGAGGPPSSGPLAAARLLWYRVGRRHRYISAHAVPTRLPGVHRVESRGIAQRQRKDRSAVPSVTAEDARSARRFNAPQTEQ